jgi:ABC-type cobalamin/Fe3+-siderophores transport system ATPase subunit
MLKRLYVHNYKCLVNFEINFDKDVSLFLGANGSGKTSVLTALYEIQKFIIFNVRLDDKRLDDKDRVFKTSSLTRWGDDLIQKFEIDIEGNDGVYKYIFEIEHNPEKNFPRVKTENLFFNNQPVYKFSIEIEGGMQAGKGRMFNDNKPDNDGIPYATDWFSSGLGSVQERYDNKTLFWFKKWLEKLFIIHINPNAIKIDMEREESHPELDLSNYVAWLNYWNNENSEGVFSVISELKKTIKGFGSFKFSQAGAKKILEVKIKKHLYRFDELSDGQKALAALYTVIYCVPENSVIFIDEPENFLALPEIQPWLNVLREQCKERNIQALLISHHPSLINLLATHSGYWFSRQDNHTRIEKITPQDDDGLSLAQLIEMGWIYGD